MSDKKAEKSEQGGDHILGKAFRASLQASRDMQQTAIDVPLNILQHLGVGEDKMDALREKSHEMISGLYHTIDSVAVKTGFVKAHDEAEAQKKKAAKG